MEQVQHQAPQAPPINLSIGLQKPDDYRMVLLNKYKQFEGSTSNEINSKYDQLEEINPEIMYECEGEGIKEKIIDKRGKFQCPRCEGWFLDSQKQSHKDSHSSQILDWLYLGGERNANNYKELTVRTNIQMVLNVASEVSNYYPINFEYLKIPIYDTLNQDIEPYLEEGVEFIRKAKLENKNILVHCIQGISRSTSYVLAYLMKYENLNLKQAFTIVKERRNIAKPNPKFVQALLKYEFSIFGKNSVGASEINPLSKFVLSHDQQIIHKEKPKDTK